MTEGGTRKMLKLWELTFMIWKIFKKKIVSCPCPYLSYILNIVLVLIISIMCLQSMQTEDSRLQYPSFAAEERSTSSRPPVRSSRRVLCMVVTSPANYYSKAVHLAATWGAHCDRLVFISDPAADKPANLHILELQHVAGRKHLWQKVTSGIVSVYQKYQADFDYLLKVDDDTFIVVDNLRHLLSLHQAEEEFVLGHHQQDQGVSYLSGGSGYVISKPALHRLVRDGLDPKGQFLCRLPHPFGQEISVYPNEDLQMGKCALILNIKLVSSQLNGETTFFPFNFERHLIQGLRLGWWLNRTLECPDCVSPHLVSLHYVQPHMMYVLHYFTNQFTRTVS